MKTLSCQTTIELHEELGGPWHAVLYVSHMDSDAMREGRFGVVTGVGADPILAVTSVWQNFELYKARALATSEKQP